MFLTVLLALALSFDCLSVGLSYGLRNIMLPWYGILIICCCSGIVLAISMLLGGLLEQMIAPTLVQFFGAGLLIALGVWILGKSIKELAKEDRCAGTFVSVEYSSVGYYCANFKRTANAADLDRSGIISMREAVWWGWHYL